MSHVAFPLEPLAGTHTPRIRPLYLPEALLLFGIPTALLALGVWVVWPALMTAGMSRGYANAAVFIVFCSLMIVAALVAYVLEGNPLTWNAFIVRYRLQMPGWRTWLWTLGGVLIAGAAALGLNALLLALYKSIGFTIPDQSSGLTDVLVLGLILFTNIVGEELWWRGYILPRQELAYGSRTWLVHGVMWAFFHSFKPWALPVMLLYCLIIPYIAQRTRSNWPPIIIHFLINGSGWLMLLLS
jgi:membrane protease YdiL (CAAX protease family)